MDNKYWLHKWQMNDILFHEPIVNEDLMAYLDKCKLEPGATILVPLCGKSNDMLWLAEQGYKVIGVELSSVACNQFFSEINVIPQITQQHKFTKFQYGNIVLLNGDLFDLIKSDVSNVTLIYDCKALIALPPELRQKYVDKFVTLLEIDFKILLMTRESNCKVEPPPYPIDANEVNELYRSHFSIECLKHLPVTAIPERLIKKGYTQITDGVYLIARKICSNDSP